MNSEEGAGSLITELPPPLRLAIAYAPRAARPAWCALFAFDDRLRRSATGPREAVLAQIKLAWWRERLGEPAARWPRGEPLLAALRPWDAERASLVGLVDGWEGLVGGEPSQAEIEALIAARAGACMALARLLGQKDRAGAALNLGRLWATRDLHDLLRTEAGVRAATLPPPPAERLPRALRPLLVAAEIARSGEDRAAFRLLRIMRAGLLGR